MLFRYVNKLFKTYILKLRLSISLKRVILLHTAFRRIPNKSKKYSTLRGRFVTNNVIFHGRENQIYTNFMLRQSLYKFHGCAHVS